MSLAIATPAVRSRNSGIKQSATGKLAFWKMILPKKQIEYTAKDGSRQVAVFDDAYLNDLAKNKAVDSLKFMLADADNRHTMDPERARGDVVELAVREDGLYGKVVFPNVQAAQAVLDNPDLGVSARIRENVQRSDGSTVNRGLIHVLGTLDPQVSGMPPWEATDLSTDNDDVLDLSNEEYQDMPKAKDEKAIEDYTDADIEAMSDEELDAFLAANAPGFSQYNGSHEDDEDKSEDEDESDEEDHEHEDAAKPELVGAGADMSKEVARDIELANQQAADAQARANAALKRVADAEWREERTSLLADGVPPHALDLAAPVLARVEDMVIDLSNEDGADVNVSEVVRGLLDALKGTVDLSVEEGHGGHWNGNGDDPDKAMLDAWANQA